MLYAPPSTKLSERHSPMNTTAANDAAGQDVEPHRHTCPRNHCHCDRCPCTCRPPQIVETVTRIGKRKVIKTRCGAFTI
jgi:hypothetical protein